MYLLLDIGNSRVKISIATESERGKQYALPTCMVISEPFDIFLLACIMEEGYTNQHIQKAFISSVVPECNELIERACTHLGIQPLFVTQDVSLPLKTSFVVPPMEGVDRLVLSYGAYTLYPNTSCIVVSYGTATTFNCIQNGVFIGGVITAGVMQSLHGLVTSASQISSICLHPKKGGMPCIAQGTKESLEIGFTECFASMTEGMLGKLSKEMGGDPIFIACGGMASTIASYTTLFTAVHEDLVLDGLYHLAVHHASKK